VKWSNPDGQAIPIACPSLSEADWQEIQAAFASNQDPLFGAECAAECRARYASLVAAPGAASDPLGAELGCIASRRIPRSSPLTPVAPACRCLESA
jgi:hypothetical protein